MRGFESPDELMEFCAEGWRDDADPSALEELSLSPYLLDDLGLDESETMEDEGFLTELFQGHSSIYEVFGELRTRFEPGFPLFKVLAAAHPRTPVAALAQLAGDSDAEVLWAVAGNPSAGPNVLERLAASTAMVASGIEGRAEPWPDDDPQSPTGIRYGNSLPLELENVPVAASVAGNRSCPEGVLAAYANASHPDLAKALILRNGDRLSDSQWQSLFDGGAARSSDQETWIKWIAVSPHAPRLLFPKLLQRDELRVLLMRRLVVDPRADDADLRLVDDSNPDDWTEERLAGRVQ